MKLIKKLLKRKLLAITIIGFIFFAWAVSYFIFQNFHHDNQIASASQGTTDSTLSANESPIRLKIPVINVDAVVEYVGLTPDGAMDSPVGPAPVGWYNLGPRPGESGSAVIDGHSGWKGGKPAVFDNLYKLKIGDKVSVESNTGVTNTFVVKKISKFSPNADATNVFISTDGKSHLNLITCTGFWNKILKSHSDRLVVFTDKE